MNSKWGSIKLIIQHSKSRRTVRMGLTATRISDAVVTVESAFTVVGNWNIDAVTRTCCQYCLAGQQCC
jgi:hypothetical protein